MLLGLIGNRLETVFTPSIIWANLKETNLRYKLRHLHEQLTHYHMITQVTVTVHGLLFGVCQHNNILLKTSIFTNEGPIY